MWVDKAFILFMGAAVQVLVDALLSLPIHD